MMTLKDQEILKKIERTPKDNNEPHECDNKPSPFRNLTLEELEYLQAHPTLLKLAK